MKSTPTAEAAATASERAAGDGLTGRSRPPRETFVRHSPGAAIRLPAPTTSPPATINRRSDPSAERNSWSRAPCRRNQGRSRTTASVDLTSWRSLQRKTSRPQLPKGGFATNGSPIGTSGSPRQRTVRGCGRLASPRRSAVRSLSCAARSASARLSTGKPRRSSRSRARSPGSIPSSDGKTSSRPRATASGFTASTGFTRTASTPASDQAWTSSTFVVFVAEPTRQTWCPVRCSRGRSSSLSARVPGAGRGIDSRGACTTSPARRGTSSVRRRGLGLLRPAPTKDDRSALAPGGTRGRAPDASV